MSIFTKWYYGTSEIEVSGEQITRLINICQRQNICFYTKNKDKETCLFLVLSNYKNQFLLYLDKLDLKYIIINEKGLPYILKKYKNRIWIVGFAVAIVFLLWYFSCFIWNITIVGTNDYTAEQINHFIVSNCISIGTKKKEIDCNNLEQQLRKEYSELGWINCYLDGTRLVVEVLETIPPSYNEKMNGPCNIIATKDAFVEKIITTNGYSMISSGMEVKKGDVLITGALPTYNDFGEELGPHYVKATGEVYGIVTYNYEDMFSLDYKHEEVIDCKKYCSIHIGKFKIGLSPKLKKDWNSVMTYSQLKLGDSFYLPISICKETQSKSKYENSVYTEEEAFTIANKKLDLYIDELRKKGVEILQNNVKIQIENGRCIAVGEIICKESIGIAIPIEVVD